MDGFEVAERIQQELGLVGMAIMMLTSDNRREDIPRCRQLGISQYLVKPVKRSNLYHAIIDALNHHDEPVVEPRPDLPKAPDEYRSWRILLVEDSKDNRYLIQSYLKNSSFEIDIAENGEIAVGKFTSTEYDLVLMDMQMPVMDGYMATKEIRKWERGQMRQPIPIVALTAHALKEDAGKSFEAGCNDHITKPVKKSLLLETINEYLGRRQDDAG